MQSLLYLSEEIEDRAERPTSLTRRQGFCTAAGMKMTLCLSEGVVAEFTFRKQELLLDQPIIAALFTFSQLFRH